MAETQFNGSCICGAVNYRIANPFSFFQYCHCSRCRKTSGSAHAANILVKNEQFQWTQGADKVSTWQHPNAGFCNAFCTSCGSKLPWKTESGLYMVVPAGTLDDDLPHSPERSIHWESRANWYHEVGSLPVVP